MIGVDTNVLLRLFVNDDEIQHKAAVSFFSERGAKEPAFVSSPVLVELIWALSKRYGYEQEKLLDLLAGMTSSSDFVVEHSDLVSKAVDHCRNVNAGVIDTLVALVAEARGCVKIVTFDRDAAKRVSGMELLK